MTIKPSNYNSLSPFKAWVQQALPAIYDDSLSYTDLLARMLKYINMLVENNNALTSDMKNAISYINNYFDNLDVQENIDKKLDEMVEDGTLTNIVNTFFKGIKSYDYYLNTFSSYDPNDISKVFDELLTKMKPYQTAILLSGDYKTNETINLHLPKNSKIEINGTIKNDHNGDCFNISGEMVEININEIIGYDTSSLDNTVNSAIKIDKVLTYSNIKINHIEWFRNAILFQYTDNTQFAQYNRFDFNYFQNCYYGIHFDGTSHLGWVNENNFYGGRLLGGYGVYMEGGTSELETGFDNNKFIHIGFEELTKEGIHIDGQAYANTFQYCRMIENIDGLYIYENVNGSGTGLNKFIFSSAISQTKFTINGLLSTIDSVISETLGGQYIAGGVVYINDYNYLPLSENSLIISTIQNVEITCNANSFKQTSFGFAIQKGYELLAITLNGWEDDEANNINLIKSIDSTQGIYSILTYNPTANTIKSTIKVNIIQKKF